MCSDGRRESSASASGAPISASSGAESGEWKDNLRCRRGIERARGQLVLSGKSDEPMVTSSILLLSAPSDAGGTTQRGVNYLSTAAKGTAPGSPVGVLTAKRSVHLLRKDIM